MLQKIKLDGIQNTFHCRRITVVSGLNSIKFTKTINQLESYCENILSPDLIDNLNKYVDYTKLGFGVKLFMRQVKVLNKTDDRIILIKYPEVGLHGPEQSNMIQKLIYQVQQKSMQIFMLTHSDHVINALRVAIKEKKINRNDVIINWFNNKCNRYFFTAVEIDNNGELSSYPLNFLDEWQNQLMKLM